MISEGSVKGGTIRVFGKKRDKEMDSLQMVKLYNVATLVDAESMLARLKSEGIPCYRMEQGAGSFHAITGGLNPVGFDIYVAKKDFERAVGILGL